MITGTHWSPLSSSLPSFSISWIKRKEVKTKQAVPYDCLVLELLQWIYCFSLWAFLPHFSFSNANALPPICPPLLFARVCCFFFSVFLMLGRIDLLMVRGIKLGRFATRYDGIFYKRNRIQNEGKNAECTSNRWAHSKYFWSVRKRWARGFRLNVKRSNIDNRESTVVLQTGNRDEWKRCRGWAGDQAKSWSYKRGK